jgi:hypothetical protein
MTPYILLIISAAFRALVQIIVFNQAHQSWLPEIVFTWDLREGTVFDAYHIYQGIWEVLAMVGFYLLGGLDWWIIAGVILIYWQCFNLFFHIIFRLPQFWRWPLPFST